MLVLDLLIAAVNHIHLDPVKDRGPVRVSLHTLDLDERIEAGLVSGDLLHGEHPARCELLHHARVRRKQYYSSSASAATKGAKTNRSKDHIETCIY